jgi:hypothetical protein
MRQTTGFATEFSELFEPSTPEMRDRFAEEDAEFSRSVEVYVAGLISRTSKVDEPARTLDLQQRMLAYLMLRYEPEVKISVAVIAEGIAARNRKQVRDAGRCLVEKGIFSADVEPDNGPEGERVLGFGFTEAIESEFDTHLDSYFKSLEDDCAAAVKQ